MIRIDAIQFPTFPTIQFNGRLNPKAISVAFAVGIHLIGLYAFTHFNQSHVAIQPPHEQSLTIYLVAPTVQPVQPDSEPSPGAKSISTHTAVKHATPTPHVTHKLVTSIEPISTPIQAITLTAPPMDADNKPISLSLDPADLVKNIPIEPEQDERSELVKMIESHGGTVHLHQKTKMEKFGEAVQAATIPDCISADTSGLGLLAIPFAIHGKITGKCR